MADWSHLAPRPEPYFDEDPWLRWICQRPDGNVLYQLLCEADPQRPALDMPAVLRSAGWQVPQVYGAQARFFTASRACGSQPPAWPPQLPMGSLRVECGNPVYRYATAALPSGSVPRAAKGAATTAPWAQEVPVIAVVDSGLGFLHRQFRRSGLRQTRLLAYWDQGAGSLERVWSQPAEFGYGRELDASDIDTLLGHLGAGGSEAQLYADLAHPCPSWSHGHHVLALAGAQPHPVNGHADAAGDCPLIAVQVPDAAFASTQGQWLKVYLLDALHYILARAPAASPVIVNISLGAHSGRHDGDGMLERAIDALMDEQQGRLTVVLAAGNSREVGAHAGTTLAPQSAAEFALVMEGNDPSANFVEFWARASGAGAALRASVQAPGATAPALLEARLEPDQVLGPAAAWLVQPPGTAFEQRSLAQFSVGRLGAGRWGGVEAQLLLCVAQTETGMGLDRPPTLPGRWTVRLENLGSLPLTLDAWVGRDDDPGVAGEARRNHKAFTPDTRRDFGCLDGSLSDLAWTRSAIVVGGYVAALDGSAPARMYKPSGAGWPAGRALAEERRAGPDLCAPALLIERGQLMGVGDVNCLSDPGQETPSRPWKALRQGTSLAAPLVCRRIATLMLAEPGLRGRAALLQRLVAQPGPLVDPPGQPEWTSRYWLPL